MAVSEEIQRQVLAEATSATPTGIAVNYDDERFTQVENDKDQALSELEQTYAGMIGESDKYYQAQIDASKQWADKQAQLQQDQTDFAIEQIEQQKQQANKDYIKEQSGAYVDWQKQSNQYGSEAEKMASAGLANTGYSESSQVSMYNTYQNRVATARESYNQAVLNYDNAIKDARLQNNSVLAEIAYQALQQQLELSLQGFQYKNNLILEQANKKLEVDQMYYNRYQDVLNQINTEIAMTEEIRQYNQNYELQVKQFDEQIRQYNQSYDEQVRQFNEEIARLKKKDEQEYQLQIQEMELKKQQLAEEKRQWEAEMAFKKEQLAEDKRQFDAQMALKTASSSGSGGSGGSGGSTTIKKSSTSTTKNSSFTTTSVVSSAVAKQNQSVIDLGYGPINSQTLANKIASGAVETYKDEDGTTLVRKTNTSGIPTLSQTLATLRNPGKSK